MRHLTDDPTNSGNESKLSLVVGEDGMGQVDDAFKNRGTMRRTKRSPNERRFKCDQCERMFFTRKDVKRHLVVHTGVRNYACPFCQQRFGRKDHLVRHAKKSHQKDTRTSAPNLGPVPSVNRRISFGHSPQLVDQVSPSLSPARLASNSCTNIDNNVHSPCNYSNPNPSMDSPSLMLLGGTSNGHHNSHENCYPGNPPTNGTMSTQLTDGSFSLGPMHPSLCEPPPPLFNNSSHYFGLGPGPSPFMNPTYITNCFGHFSVNPNNGNNQGLSGPVCGSDQANPVSLSNPLPHYSMDANLSNHLPHFNQVFQ